MPTGYTAAVQNGEITTLREFAMLCVRAMGVAIAMRDEPMDRPLPEAFEPRTEYHDKGILAARERLEWLSTLTTDAIETHAQAAYEADLKRFNESEARRQEQESRYQNMLAQVEAWQVPEDISGLRGFMLDQLRQSIDFDCSPTGERPVKVAGPKWFEQEKTKADWELGYHTQQRDAEVKRANERNEWLRTFRAALEAGR